MHDAKTVEDRWRRKAAVVAGSLGAVFLYYVTLSLAHRFLISRFDLRTDVHIMGSSTLSFPYWGVVTAAALLPGLVVPLVLGWRRGSLVYVVVPAAGTAVMTTGLFYLTRAHTCDPGRSYPDELIYSLGSVVGLAVIAAVAGFIRGRRRPDVRYAEVTSAVAMSAVLGYLFFLQEGTCWGWWDIDRIMLPATSLFWFVIAYPVSALGAVMGRRLARP